MPVLNAHALDALFLGYGFKPDTPHEHVRVYFRTEGYFQNAEIVPLQAGAPVEAVRSDLERSGFACKVSRFESVEDAERLLFRGFFQQDATAARLLREYGDFCEKTGRSLGSTYEYINVAYLLDGQVPDSGKTATAAIRECFAQDGPVLVFLEAAAGFGKTCTAFDLLHHFLTGNPARNPILAELRRNRQARIFKYVLYDEMHRNYRACGLTPEMVEREIKSGRIPLIIDGFDELLHLDREGNAAGQFAEVEPMLRTLSGILESQAKVLVTTRRTAVLGESFDDWLAELVEKGGASAHRFTLQEPRIEDWIGQIRRRALEDAGFPLKALANPVLLAFIRTLGDDDFEALRGERTGLVKKYFDSLLDRERIRQELPLSAVRQMEILQTIADSLLTKGSSSLPREELRQLVLERHHKMLGDALKSAPEIAARTPEELADKLTDHALLDRKSGVGDGIGFVNDFVGGTLSGLAMLERDEDEWFDESEMDKAVTAFRFRDDCDRIALWEHLNEASEAVDASWQLRFDLQLRGQVHRALRDSVLHDVSVSDCSLGQDHDLLNAVFIRCSFTRVVFHADRMSNVGFVGCSFHSCEVRGQLDATRAWFDRDCVEFGGAVIILPAAPLPAPARGGAVAGPDYERVVLEQFWPPGRPHARQVLQVRTLYQGTASQERSDVAKAIDALRVVGLLSVADRLATLDFSRMAEVREKLGR